MTVNSSPRFLLILSSHSNLLRAALVTRDLKIVSSAQQPFEFRGNEFDPAEVWYKTKKVIAACLDIGRTHAREIVGLAIVTHGAETIEWKFENQEIVARGKIGESNSAALSPSVPNMFSGTMASWLVWNLTGNLLDERTNDYGTTRAHSPFDAQVPIVAVLKENDTLGYERAENVPESDRAMLGTARCAWGKIRS